MESFVAKHLDYYGETQGVLPERLAEFGDSYRDQGYLTRDQLYEIAYESSTRSAYHAESNPTERCREVTRNVRTVEGDFSKVQLLTEMRGECLALQRGDESDGICSKPRNVTHLYSPRLSG